MSGSSGSGERPSVRRDGRTSRTSSRSSRSQAAPSGSSRTSAQTPARDRTSSRDAYTSRPSSSSRSSRTSAATRGGASRSSAGSQSTRRVSSTSSRGARAGDGARSARASGAASRTGRGASSSRGFASSPSGGRGGIAAALGRNRALRVVVGVVLAVLLALLVDWGAHLGKAYTGVTIGGLDVSGLTKTEIVELLEQSYGQQLADAQTTVYASDSAYREAQANTSQDDGADDAEEASEEEDAAAEDGSVDDGSVAEEYTFEATCDEDGQAVSWTVLSSQVAASIPYEQLAEQALSVGRGEEGFGARIDAARNGREIALQIDYGDEELEALAATLDETLGIALVDYDIVVEDGVASVTEGSDGLMVDRDTLAAELDAAFLDAEDDGFVAYAVDAPVRIDEEAAQAVCDAVNEAIADGALLTCNGGELEVSRSTLGSWVYTEVEEDDEGSYELVAHLSADEAHTDVAAFAREHYDGEELVVSFEEDDEGEVLVSVVGDATVAQISQAVEDLEEAVFAADGDGTPSAEVVFGEPPESMTLEEALELGVVEEIGTYTTSFSTASGTENRRSNIALAASYLTNSIVEPGESWSFNDTCGERSEERGFLPAAAIVDGEYATDVGGGICQVATTVFNAVYESGLPITSRHPHSLYISTYPAGRDAAVSWPDLDLEWSNDTDSSILLCVSCETSSITTTLYGVDLGYSVTTETGEWTILEYDTVEKSDSSLSAGARVVETSGVNGRSISIVRTVTDSTGAVVRSDTFKSTYAPVDEVVLVGPTASASEDDSADDAETDA